MRRFILGLTLVGVLVGGTAVFAYAQAINNGGEIPLGDRPWQVFFVPGSASVALTTYLVPDRPQGYRLWLGAGRHLHLSLRGTFSLQVSDPQGQPVTPVSKPPGPLSVDLTQTGDYGIALQGVGQATVLVYVPPLEADQVAPVPPPAVVGRLPSLPGAGPAVVNVRLDPTQPRGYQFSASAGQVVTVTLTGSAIPALLPAGGMPLAYNVSDSGAYTFDPLPADGDYTLDLNGGGDVTFTVGLTEAGASPAPDRLLSPPMAEPTAAVVAPTPTIAQRSGASSRVVFPPGGTSSSFIVQLDSAAPQKYVLWIQAGQRLFVIIGDNAGASVQIVGPDGAPVALERAGQQWSAAAVRAGDYTVVISGSGPASVTLSVPLH